MRSLLCGVGVLLTLLGADIGRANLVVKIVTIQYHSEKNNYGSYYKLSL